MLVSPFALALLFSASAPQLMALEDGRFRVSILFDDKRAQANANAQIMLQKAASKHCKGKGQAISEGTLELNNAPPIRDGKDALELAEVYRCGVSR